MGQPRAGSKRFIVTRMDSKICVVCGRVIEPRKKWLKNWAEVKYCSDACRRRRQSNLKVDEEAIVALLKTRGAGKTICPSEILEGNEKSDHSRMEQVREAARRLVQQNLIEITQKGRVVDPSAFKGPIRLRLKEPGLSTQCRRKKAFFD